jgi:methyl-accepting chemotaxis protein
MQGLRFNINLRAFIIVAILTPAAVFAIDIASLPYWISLIIIAVAITVFAVLAIKANQSLAQYRQGTADAVNKIAKGDFTPQPSEAADDELITAVQALAVLLKRFTDELNQTAKTQAAGAASIDDKRWEGAYRDAIKNVNTAYTNHLKDFDAVTECITTLSKGELRPNAALSGERIKTAEALEALTGNMRLLFAEIQTVQQAVSEGRLNYKADAGRLGGELGKAVSRLGEATDAVAAPVNELKNMLERLKRGELSISVTRSYKGEYGELFQSVDQFASMISLHNKELLAVLGEIARFTPGRSARRDYGGAFPSFKSAVNDACERLDQLDKTAPTTKPAAGFTPGRPATSIRPAAAKPAAAKADTFTSAQPSLGQRTVVAPSAAKVYDAKDFGKY